MLLRCEAENCRIDFPPFSSTKAANHVHFQQTAAMMEHRVGTRVKIGARSQLRGADQQLSEAIVRNASLSGAFMETNATLPMLSRVAIRPVTQQEWLEGCVVRREEAGVAIEWLEPGVHAVHLLLASGRAAAAGDQTQNAALESSIQQESLARARSEVISGEFDVQG